MDMQIVRRGTPPPPWGDDIPYYWEGEEFVETTDGWVEGLVTAGVTMSKNPTSLQVHVVRSSSTTRTGWWETNNKIDITNISLLKYTFLIETDTDVFETRFAIHDVKGSTSRTAEVSLTSSDVVEELALDVSGVMGEYYIKFRGLVSQSATTGNDLTLKGFKVWGIE